MGGVDKGLVPFEGRAMVCHVLERLHPQVERLMINANRHTADYARWAPVVTDAPDLPAAAGPLVGVASGLRASPDPWLLCVPCDSPWLPLDLATRLWQALLDQGARANDHLTPRVATVHAGGRRQGVFLLLNRACLPALETWLQGGGRKVNVWLDQMVAAEASWEDATPFSNFNTPEDLAQATAQRNQDSKG